MHTSKITVAGCSRVEARQNGPVTAGGTSGKGSNIGLTDRYGWQVRCRSANELHTLGSFEDWNLQNCGSAKGVVKVVAVMS